VFPVEYLDRHLSAEYILLGEVNPPIASLTQHPFQPITTNEIS
jgi:hypothetical protein